MTNVSDSAKLSPAEPVRRVCGVSDFYSLFL